MFSPVLKLTTTALRRENNKKKKFKKEFSTSIASLGFLLQLNMIGVFLLPHGPPL